MGDIIIYGVGPMARVAAYYLRHDSSHEVVAFTTTEAGQAGPSPTPGVPVLPSDEVVDAFSPARHQMFVAIESVRLNAERERAFLHAREMGYKLISYVSSRATIWPDVTIGVNCMILERAVVQPFAVIGDDVTLSAGCHIGHETIIEDHCFLAAKSVVSGKVRVGRRSSIGPNSAVRDAITIAPDTYVGAGTTVLRTTQEFSAYCAPAAEAASLSSDRLLIDEKHL